MWARNPTAAPHASRAAQSELVGVVLDEERTGRFADHA
jgi:hypothetical protein